MTAFNDPFAGNRSQIVRSTFQSSRDTEDIAIDFRFPFVGRPLFIRCHFAGSVTTKADVAIRLAYLGGDEFDLDLYTVQRRGVGADLNLIWTPDDIRHPSPWQLQPRDGLKIDWTNPGGVTWALIVGVVRDV